MAIPAIGADLVITPAEEFGLAAMALEPLQTALENVNWLYMYHRPQLVSVCPTEPAAMGRNAVVVVPIQPSADGLRYDFHTEVVGSNNTNVTVVVEYCTSYTGLPTSGSPTTWTNIFTQATGITAATRAAQLKTGQTVPATAVALRWTVSVAAGTFELHHLLAVPAPTSVANAIQASGFVPYDDGLLTVADAPVHTEFLNRCALSTAAILRDRRHMALSLCQDEAQANVDTVVTGQTSYLTWPRVRAWFPAQSGPTVSLTVSALATMSAGSGSKLIRVAQVPDAQGAAIGPCKAVELDATSAGNIKTATLQLQLQGDGLMRYADLQVAIRTTVAHTTYLHSLVASWRPGDV